MTTGQRLERDLPTILGDLAIAPYPDYVDDVLSTTAERRQRPAWTFPERWLPMDLATQRVPTTGIPWRQVGVLALIAILLAVAVGAYVGSQRRLPEPFGLASNGVVSYETGGTIYLYDPDTDTVKAIASAEGWIDPWFSPDGQRLLLAHEVTSSTVEFGVLSVDGGDIRLVTPEPLMSADWLEWSPDSDRLILTPHVEKLVGKVKSLAPTVAIIDVDDGTVTTLDTGLTPTWATFLAPLGEEIIVMSDVLGQGQQIVRMDADGSNPTTIVESAPPLQLFGRPSVSPDGSRLAYTVWDQGARLGTLHVRDLATGEDQVVGKRAGVTLTGWPRFSPDGTRILAEQTVRRGTDAHVEAVVIDLASDAVTVGDLDFSLGGAMEWSPDGRVVVVAPTGPDDTKLPHLLMDAGTGRVTPAPWTSASYPSWQRTAD